MRETKVLDDVAKARQLKVWKRRYHLLQPYWFYVGLTKSQSWLLVKVLNINEKNHFQNNTEKLKLIMDRDNARQLTLYHMIIVTDRLNSSTCLCISYRTFLKTCGVCQFITDSSPHRAKPLSVHFGEDYG